MNSYKIIVYLCVVLFGGCSATRLVYQPTIFLDTAESKKVIERGLHHQAPNHAVKSVFITSDYIKVITAAQNRVTFIHYEYINKVELHEKSDWKIVTLRGLHNDMIYRLYLKDEKLARDFINALYTLKDHQQDVVQAPGDLINYQTVFLVEDFSKRLLTGFKYCKQRVEINALDGLKGCNETLKESVVNTYNETKTEVENNKDALEALKNFYFYWITCLDSLFPAVGESDVLYQQRIYTYEIELLDREKSLKLAIANL